MIRVGYFHGTSLGTFIKTSSRTSSQQENLSSCHGAVKKQTRGSHNYRTVGAAPLMSICRRFRAVAVVVVVNIIIGGQTTALSMLVSLTSRSGRTLPLIVRSRTTLFNLRSGGLVVVAHSRGGNRAAPRRTRSGEVLSVRTMAASSASTVSLEGHVEDGQRDGVAVERPMPESQRGEMDPRDSDESGGSVLKGGLARIVLAEEPWLTAAAVRLREGKLVAFPTETVYGLGANALSEWAVLKIFEAKRRPLTDPLIVHIPDIVSALAFLDFNGDGGGGDKARRLLTLLGEKLWPGPLTLILKAASVIPACVTANTGFVGVRCPAHPVTRQLLELAGVPVAGPSANRFGHVSPTRATHVIADLGDSDIMVVDGDSSGACEVGIESTVAKIDVENNRILILRMGGVTQEKLKETLAAGGPEFAAMTVVAGSAAGGKSDTDQPEDEAATAAPESGEFSEASGQAPGQLLKHYSPDLDVFRVVRRSIPATTARQGEAVYDLNDGNLTEMAKTSAVIDFAGQLKALKPLALAYWDLSRRGDAAEAAAGLFEGLRWAERQASAERLLISGLPGVGSGDMAAAVNDRIYRAASGKTIFFLQET